MPILESNEAGFGGLLENEKFYNYSGVILRLMSDCSVRVKKSTKAGLI